MTAQEEMAGLLAMGVHPATAEGLSEYQKLELEREMLLGWAKVHWTKEVGLKRLVDEAGYIRWEMIERGLMKPKPSS